MKDETCEQLDAFLVEDLDPDTHAAFARHLAICESCRSTVEAQTRIDGLFKAATNAIPVPAGLSARIGRERNRRRDRRLSAFGSLIAASLVIGFLGWSLVFREAPDRPDSKRPLSRKHDTGPGMNSDPAPDGNPLQIAQAEPPPPVQIEFPDEILSLPIESGEPDITLIQLFPVSRVNENAP